MQQNNRNQAFHKYRPMASNMIADLGTRRGTALEDINSSSQWVNGLSWINKEVEDFLMKTVRELTYVQTK